MNESIINFLEKNNGCMVEYFKECKEVGREPNYSEFCRKYLNGTTAEGVSFNSIYVKRSELTEYLRGKYRMWVIITEDNI